MYEQLLIHGMLWLFIYFLLAPALSVSPSATHLPLNPHIHTLELCCCSCDSANCISQNPLPGGSIRFCQRDVIKGNWKWNTGGGSSFLFSSCCYVLQLQTVGSGYRLLLHSAAASLHFWDTSSRSVSGVTAREESDRVPPPSRPGYVEGASPTKVWVLTSQKRPLLWAPGFW